MIKIGWALGGLLGLAAMLPSEEATPFPSIESKCQLIWKTKTGDASFRSNVVFRGDRLWIGSNGDSFMDRGLIEPGSGVYELDRRTGKQRRHFANELFGDMDVNGLLMRSDRLYFGNDNEEFLCTDLQGKILWRNPTSGDIEHEPSLLQTKNGEVVVYAAESGEVKAVDPEQGKVIWSYYVPEFDGWKPGDDRTVFKVKAWFRNTSHFYTRPLVVDVNADGTNDLIYRTFGGNLLALNGNTGSKLWSVEEKESLSLGMAVIGRGKQKKIVALRNIYADTVRYEIAYFSLQGQKLASRPVSELSWGSGLNALSIDGDRVLINGRTKTFQVDPSGSVREIDRSIPPFGIQISLVFLVEIDRRFVPLEHLPHDAFELTGARFFDELIEQQFADSFPSAFFGDEDVFEVHGLSFPGRVADVVERKSVDEPVFFRHEGPPDGLISESALCKMFEGDGYFLRGSLIECEFLD